mgnify:CR=1 FL=1
MRGNPRPVVDRVAGWLDGSASSEEASRRLREAGLVVDTVRVVNHDARDASTLTFLGTYGRGVPVWCGGMLESGIGRAHNIAISTLAGYTMPGDVSASERYWEEDIIEPPVTVTPRGMPAISPGSHSRTPSSVIRSRKRSR